MRRRRRGKPGTVSICSTQQPLCSTYQSRSKDVLSKDNTLGLNNEEVDKLIGIAEDGIQSLLGDCVVLFGADLRSKASTEEALTSNLSQNSDTEGHPCSLEAISKDVEVSGSEDEADGGEESNARSTRVVPGEQACEEGVVVCELLASCC